MAQLPLNTFRTITAELGVNTTASIYTAPIGVTSIVLMAQVSNFGDINTKVTFIHHRAKPILRNSQGKNEQPGNTDSYLVRNYEIPVTDAGSVLTGKLILQSQDSVRAYADQTGQLQLVLSILETANT